MNWIKEHPGYAVQLLFIALKLFWLTELSWFWVLAPTIAIALILIVALLIGVIASLLICDTPRS